jgi:hypothetical protein
MYKLSHAEAQRMFKFLSWESSVDMENGESLSPHLSWKKLND